MRIVIFGSGAVGGTFGTKLHQAGHEVTFVARGTTYEKIRDEGFRFNGEIYRIPVTDDLAAAAANADVILHCTKSIDGTTMRTMEDLADTVPIITTQNTVQHPQWAHPAVVRGFMHLIAPGEVELHPGPLALIFGASPVSTALAAALEESGIDATIADDIAAEVWKKQMFVATFGPLGALFDVPLGTLCTTYRQHLVRMMNEFAAVAAATGVQVPADVMDFADAMPAESTSSMQRDYAAGKPCELDAQLGTVVALAKQHQVDTPVCTLIYDALTHARDVREQAGS